MTKVILPEELTYAARRRQRIFKHLYGSFLEDKSWLISWFPLPQHFLLMLCKILEPALIPVHVQAISFAAGKTNKWMTRSQPTMSHTS